MRRFATVAILLAVSAAVAFAQPVMIVPAEKGTGWWIREAVLRPAAKSIGSVTADEINSNLQRRRGAVEPLMVCYLGAFSSASIIGATREVQTEIDEELKQHPQAFLTSFETAAGKRFIIQTGVFEACTGEKSSYVMITDAAGKLHSFFPQEGSFTAMHKRDGGPVILTTCFYCGDGTAVHYDASRDRFYFEYIGD